MAQFYVYILSSRSRAIYVGITNHLARRLREHREGRGSAFTQKYRIHQLVYYEPYETVRSAILREKQIKGWLRAKKVALIESVNPGWSDLTPPS